MKTFSKDVGSGGPYNFGQRSSLTCANGVHVRTNQAASIARPRRNALALNMEYPAILKKDADGCLGDNRGSLAPRHSSGSFGIRLHPYFMAMLTRMTRGHEEMKDEAIEYEYDARNRGEPGSPPSAGSPRR
jgi:hypothetical protein